MSLILPHKVEEIGAPFVVVCEGYGDVCLIDGLLQLNGIENCKVGCPSRTGTGGDGRDFLNRYLSAIAAVAGKSPENPLRGVLVIVDADEAPQRAFELACRALEFAEFGVPEHPFVANNAGGLKVAVYLIPGQDQTGTLEHLLLRSAFGKAPESEACVDSFMNCIGRAPKDTPNIVAKMKMSALLAGSFPQNPWATPGPLLQSSDNDLVPLDSPHFKHLASFIAEFCRE